MTCGPSYCYYIILKSRPLTCHTLQKQLSFIKQSQRHNEFGWNIHNNCYCCRCIVDLLWTINHSTITTPRFGNAVRRTRLHLRGNDYGRSSPFDITAPAALVAGTSRRLSLRSCRYQVVIGYNRAVSPHYMGGLDYSCPTRTQLVPIHT
jgi:hypothetical protein